MHPTLATPFGDLPSYTLFVALGFITAGAITWLRHRHEGFHFETTAEMALTAAIAGLAGARLLYVATYPELYEPWFRGFARGGMNHAAGAGAAAITAALLLLYARRPLRNFHPAAAAGVILSLSAAAGLVVARLASLHARFPNSDPFDPGGGGLSFFGGLAFASVSCALLARARGLGIAAAADAVAPGLMFGCALGRIGCFLNGCCAGIPARSALAPGGAWPTQLVEAAATIAIGLALLPRLPAPAGRKAALAAGAYAVTRFSLEFVRADARPLALGLSIPQAAALAVAAAAAAFLFRNPRPAPSGAP